MAIVTKNEFGTISVPEDLVSVIAGYAAVENYGIVGMCAKRTGDSIVDLIGRDNLKKGVKITSDGENMVSVDLYVVLQYGVSLPAVAENCRNNVKYRIEDLTGVMVRDVNVHVEGIRVLE